jgi:hypothetical protein
MEEDLHTTSNRQVAAALSQFSQSSFTIARLLERGVQLTDTDRLLIENNLAIVQLRYSTWMRQFHNK